MATDALIKSKPPRKEGAAAVINVAYVTHYFPRGTSETFIWPEVLAHRRAGTEILIAPIRRAENFHRIDYNTIAAPLFSLSILSAALRIAICRPAFFAKLISRLIVGKPSIVVRNLAVLPKGLWLGQQFLKAGVDHIHAHWLSTPATAAMIASAVSGIPFSVTAHRIDISQANLIPLKLSLGRFIRAIDQNGRDEIARTAPELGHRAVLVHLGVSLPQSVSPLRGGRLNRMIIVTAARFVEKKGHQYLVQAIRIARDQGTIVQADFFGEGPLQSSLRNLVRGLGLQEQIRFRGNIKHETLLELLVSGGVDVAVLPSITADDGDREGIPAFLMEAMAAGVPVLGTNNGGVCELVRDGEGFVVPERDSNALAEALMRLSREPQLRRSMAAAGRRRVRSEFDVAASAARLRGMMAGEGIVEK